MSAFEVTALYWLSSSEQTEKRVSQRCGTFKGFVSGNPRDYKEVDDAAEKLGQSSWRAENHVPPTGWVSLLPFRYVPFQQTDC